MAAKMDVPVWWVVAATAGLGYCLYLMSEHEKVKALMRMTFPYTVEGLKVRGHPVPPEVQRCADEIDAENQMQFGNWDDPNLVHWTM